MALDALLAGAQITWLDLVKGVVLTVPVQGNLSRSFERLKRAHEALGRSA